MMAAGMLDLTHSVGVEASGAAQMLPVRRALVIGSTMTMVTWAMVTWQHNACQECMSSYSTVVSYKVALLPVVFRILFLPKSDSDRPVVKSFILQSTFYLQCISHSPSSILVTLFSFVTNKQNNSPCFWSLIFIFNHNSGEKPHFLLSMGHG